MGVPQRFPRRGKFQKVPGFLNASWPCHGSKSFQVYCPSSFPERRTYSHGFRPNLSDCSGRKWFPLCWVHHFRWALLPILYLILRSCPLPQSWALLPMFRDCSVDACRIHNPWRTVSNTRFSFPASLCHFWHDLVSPTHHSLQHSHHRLFNPLVVRMFS